MNTILIDNILYNSISTKEKLLYPIIGENLLTNRYKIGLLQARFAILNTQLLPFDETKIICLN